MNDGIEDDVSDGVIEVIVADVDGGHRGGGGVEKVRRERIDKKKLAAQMATFARAVSEVVSDTADAVNSFPLAEVKLTAELTTEGKVVLIGAEGSITGRGAIEFTFRRKV